MLPQGESKAHCTIYTSQHNYFLFRHNIHHPVVNDNVGTLWSKLGIMCWPTLLILDPSGKPIKFYMGEGKREKISEFLQVITKCKD